MAKARDDFTHGHQQIANTEIRSITFVVGKYKVYTVSKNKTWS